MSTAGGGEVSTFRGVGHRDLMPAMFGQLAPAALSVPVATDSAGQTEEFAGSEEFWDYALEDRLRGLDKLTLRDVSLTEWFPRSPGLYSMADAVHHRVGARDSLIDLDAGQRQVFRESLPLDERVYDLYGKIQMLEGGVGCLRLARRNTTYGPLWFMSATSQARVEQGVPVALTDAQYQSVIDQVRETGFCSCDITGQLLFAPEELLDLYRDYRGVPRFFLFVDSITPRPHRRRPTPEAGAAVFFTSSEPWPAVSATYVDFRLGSGPQSLSKRLPFLEYYVSMHSGTIATDFDEQFGRFANAVFSLKKITALSMAESEIRAVAESMELQEAQISKLLSDQRSISVTINNYRQETHVGDVFRDIGPGTTIINRSTVTNALNVAGERYGQEVVTALNKLVEAVASSGNSEAIDNVNGLAEELAKPEPSKGRIRTWLSAIGNALPDVAAVATALATLSPLLL